MEESRKAYLAGFVDGEGCISSYKHGQSGYYFSKLNVGNVDPRPLLIFREHYGGWLGIRTRYTQNPKHSVYYEWRGSGHKLSYILKDLMPYLVTRKLEAKLAIKLMETSSVEEQKSIHEKLQAVKRNRGRLARRAAKSKLQALPPSPRSGIRLPDGRREEVGRYHGYRGGSRSS